MSDHLFHARAWAPVRGRVGLGVTMLLGASLFIWSAPAIGFVFWLLAGLFVLLALWCLTFNVLVTVTTQGVVKVVAGGTRLLRAPAGDITRIALVSDADGDWVVRNLFGVYTIFDGRIQAPAGVPLVQIVTPKKSVAVTVADRRGLEEAVTCFGATLDGREVTGVRSYEV